jgi:deoxycytidylate deaminase
VKLNKILAALTIAEAVSVQSHDIETQVGCVLIKKATGAIIATGYNGFIRGALDALLPTSGSNKHSFMIHAEENMICNCARNGINMDDCVLICTISPCPHCTRLLWQCGITEIYCRKLHHTFAQVLTMNDIIVTNNKYDEYEHITFNRRIA